MLGGAVSTVERWPGVRVDRGSSAHVIIRHSGIVEELDLAAHGLRYLDCDPWGFAPAPRPGDPGPDGRPLVFSVDLDATCASIAGRLRPRGRRRLPPVRRRLGAAQPGRRRRVRRGHPARRGLVRSFWPLGAARNGQPRTPGGDLAVDFLGSGDALLDRWFASERLKAALAWFGAQCGPPMSRAGHRRHGRLGGAAARRPARPPGRRLRRADRRAAAAAGVRRRPGRARRRRRRACWSTTAPAVTGVETVVRTADPRRRRRRRVPHRRHAGAGRATPPRPPSPTPTRRSATGSAWSSARSPTPCPPIPASTPTWRCRACSCCAPTAPSSPPRTATGAPAGCPAPPSRWR